MKKARVRFIAITVLLLTAISSVVDATRSLGDFWLANAVREFSRIDLQTPKLLNRSNWPQQTAPPQALGSNPQTNAIAAAFTPGDPVVCRVGDGSTVVGTSAAPVFLDEYTPGGTLVQSIPLPTVGVGLNKMLTVAGSASNECHITRSTDGRFILITGYDAAPGTAGIATSSTGTVLRVIGRVDWNGAVDTTTTTTSFNGSGIRSATSSDGTSLWAIGAASGVVSMSLSGSGTGTIVSTTITNNRVINIFNGQLYTSDNSGSVRLGTVGAGLPVTSGQTITNLPGFPTSGSPNGFFFADLNASVAGLDTLYVADDGSGTGAAGGGVKKFALVAGVWTYNGTFPANGTTIPAAQFFGLTGNNSASTVTLYATRTSGSPSTSQLVSFTDTSGYNVAPSAVPTLLATQSSTTSPFRGVALAPVAAAPEMNVKGNGATVADGDVTPSLADHTDFGSADVAVGTVVRTFTIENLGTADLNLTGTPKVAVSGTNAGDFSVTALPTSPIAPAGSTTFQVTFAPTARGPRAATINIANNDSDENPYNFDIRGNGLAPEVGLSTNSLMFGDQTVSTTSSPLSLKISNNGDPGHSLVVGSISMTGANPGDFAVTETFPQTIAAGSSFTAHLTFTPAATGPRSASLTVNNDDPLNSAPEASLTGNGVPATSLVVTTTADTDDGFCAPADCSLREAINAANFSTDANTITFNIPGGGVKTISPTTALPTITQPLTIDGYSQPSASANTLAVGSDAVFQVEIDGSVLGGSFLNGLTINTSNSTIKGLVINSFSGRAIFIQGGSSNVIAGNRLGTDAAGSTFDSDLLGGVLIFNSTAATVGGSTPADRNLISESSGISVQLVDSTGDSIINNYIGTNAQGTAQTPTGVGILFQNADNNTIGGSSANQRNVFATGGTAIGISGNNNTIQGNYIGTDATGTVGLQSQGSGVFIGGASQGNTIGGTDVGAGNVIASCGLSDSQEAGVKFSGDVGNGLFPSNNVVQGNFIGTDITGTEPLPNVRGIDITNAHNNIIGGTTTSAHNVISGNLIDGIRIQGPQATENLIQGNLIGTAVDGSSSLPQSANGVRITSTAANNTIGGTATGAGNVIVFNGQVGVELDEVAGSGNSVVGNSMFSNLSLGIDIGPAGVTPNDISDADTGSNDLQNFPIITNVSGSGSSMTITGSLNSTPGQTFEIDFYSNDSCDSTGSGEGRTYLGRQTTAPTDGIGDVGFVFNPGSVPADEGVITATATNANGSTSEFSQCFGAAVQHPGTLTFDSATYSANESTPISPAIVNRLDGTDGSVSANYSFTDGTAVGGAACTAGVDYINTGGTVTLDNGQTNAFIDVTVCDDAVYEPNAQGFSISLSNPTGGSVIGSPGSAGISIADNDAPPNFHINDVSHFEGNSGTTSYVFTVTKSGKSEVDASVDFETQDDIATQPSDYTATSGTLTFLPADTQKQITVTVNGDADVEPDELFFVQLSNPVDALISDGSGTGAIVNDDATIGFESDKFKGAEGTSVTVTVDRTGDTGGTSSVVYTVSDGTATGGSCSTGKDYVSESDTLTFGPGETSKNFQVQLCGDMLSENPAETINLTLSSPSNGTLGQSTATLRILDAATQVVSNTPILLSDGLPGSPYPSTITVSGPGVISGLRLTLFDVTKATSNDLTVMLVDPSGSRHLIFMANTGGANPLDHATITLEDAAPSFIPFGALITDGQNYKPTDCLGDSLFPTPAPAAPHNQAGCGSVASTFGSVFGGANPNGAWSLYVLDEQDGDQLVAAADSIGGWGIQFLTPTAARVNLSGRVRMANGSAISNAIVTVSGGDLSQPVSARTSSFGYYTVHNLTAGQAYVVTASARTHTFSPRFAQLFDDMPGFDLIADR